MEKALFLDRDGVINIDKGFVHRVQDIEWMPGVIQGLRLFGQAGFRLVIVTNQSGIARGLFSEFQYLEFQYAFESLLEAEGVVISKTYYCPHHPQGQVVEFRKICECRKPGPGMLLEAKRQFGLKMQDSVLIGDRVSDMVAATVAGVGRYFLIGSHHGTQGPYRVFPSVFDVARYLLVYAGTNKKGCEEV